MSLSQPPASENQIVLRDLGERTIEGYPGGRRQNHISKSSARRKGFHGAAAVNAKQTRQWIWCHAVNPTVPEAGNQFVVAQVEALQRDQSKIGFDLNPAGRRYQKRSRISGRERRNGCTVLKVPRTHNCIRKWPRRFRGAQRFLHVRTSGRKAQFYSVHACGMPRRRTSLAGNAPVKFLIGIAIKLYSFATAGR